MKNAILFIAAGAAVLYGVAWLFSWAINTAAQEEEKEYSGLIEED